MIIFLFCRKIHQNEYYLIKKVLIGKISPKAWKELAMAKKYIVDLSKTEKAGLVELTQKGRPGARKIKRANRLLLAAAGKPDLEIAELLHTSWTLQLLADRLVTLTHLESLSYEAVRLVLKKTTSNHGSGKSGAFRPSSALNLFGGWRTSWICMPSLSIRPIR
jgi:hypothetical protein